MSTSALLEQTVPTTVATSSLFLKAFSNQLDFFLWCSALSFLHAHLISSPHNFHNFCSSHLKRNAEFSICLYFIQQTHSDLGNGKHERFNIDKASRQIQENTLYSPQLLFHRFYTLCTLHLLLIFLQFALSCLLYTSYYFVVLIPKLDFSSIPSSATHVNQHSSADR